MTCDDALPLLLERADGELSTDARAPLEEHLRECRGCRERLTELFEEERFIARSIAVSVPPGFASALAEAVWERADEARRRHAADRRMWLLVAAVSAAAGAAVFVLGLGSALEAWEPVARALEALPRPPEMAAGLFRALSAVSAAPAGEPFASIPGVWLLASAAAVVAQLLLARRLLSRREA